MAAAAPDGAHPWARWLRAQLRIQNIGQAELARRSNGAFSTSAVSRWIKGATPTVDDVSAACAALRVPVLDFLLAAGYVADGEPGVVVQRRDLAKLTKRELLAEQLALHEEIAERIPDDEPASHAAPLRRTVVPLVRPEGTEGQDWAAYHPQD